MNPWERSIDIIVRTLIAMPSGTVGLGMITAGGLWFAFDGNKLAALGWLWPDRRLSLGLIGLGTFLNAARICIWLVRG